MKNYINFTIATSFFSIGAVIVLVLLIDNLVLAALAAVLVLIGHTMAIVAYGYYEIKAEFGIKKMDRTKMLEMQKLSRL